LGLIAGARLYPCQDMQVEFGRVVEPGCAAAGSTESFWLPVFRAAIQVIDSNHPLGNIYRTEAMNVVRSFAKSRLFLCLRACSQIDCAAYVGKGHAAGIIIFEPVAFKIFLFI